MATRKRKPGRLTGRKRRSVRATFSLPPDVYRTLEALATQKKVSTSWVLREAAEQYVAAQWPLLETTASDIPKAPGPGAARTHSDS